MYANKSLALLQYAWKGVGINEWVRSVLREGWSFFLHVCVCVCVCVCVYDIYRVSLSLDAPNLLFIKNYVIEIMTWKFIYTYRERCKTGPAHSRWWSWSPFTSKHNWMHFSKFWNTFPKVSKLTAWISWRVASLSCSICEVYFCTLCPSIGPQRKKSAGVRSASPCI